MNILGIEVGPVGTVCNFVATITYVLLVLSYIIKNKTLLYIVNNLLSIFYALSWTTCIIGLMISNIFYKKIVKRDKLHRLTLVAGDMLLHVLPVCLLYYYGPTKSDVKISYLILATILFMILSHNYLLKIYVGVPKYILLYLGPLIFLSSFYYLFSYKN